MLQEQLIEVKTTSLFKTVTLRTEAITSQILAKLITSIREEHKEQGIISQYKGEGTKSTILEMGRQLDDKL